MADDLTVQLIAVVDQFNANMQAATSAVQDAASQMSSAMDKLTDKVQEDIDSQESRWDELKDKLKEVAEAWGVFEAFKMGKEVIEGATEAAEKMHLMAVQTGVTIEEMQKLQYASAATGVPLERLPMMVERLMLSAESGSKRAEAGMRALGISVTDLGGDPYNMLLKMGDALDRMGPSSAKARQAFGELFGPRGMMFIEPISQLRELSEELEHMGIVMNDQTVAGLVAAQEDFNKLGFVVKQDEMILTALFTPALRALTEGLTQVLAGLGATVNQSQTFQERARAASVELIKILRDITLAVADAAYHAVKDLESIAAAMEKILSVAYKLLVIPGIINFALHPLTDFSSQWKKGADGVESDVDRMNKSINTFFDNMIKTAGTAPKIEPTGGGAGGLDTSIADARKAKEAEAAAKKLEELHRKQLADFEEDQRLEVLLAGDTADVKVEAAKKDFDEAVKLFGARSREATRAAAGELQAEQSRFNQTREIYNRETDDITKAEMNQLKMQEDHEKALVDMKLVSHQQMNTDELKFVNEEEALELKALTAKMANYKADTKEYQALADQKLAIEQKYQAERQRIVDDGNKQQMAQTQELATRIGNQFQGLFRQIIEGHQSMTQIAVGLLKSLAEEAIAIGLKMLVATLFQQQTQQLQYARVAGAGAYAALAWIPLIGPALGAAAAAEAFAMSMAFEKGGIVPSAGVLAGGGVPAIVHPGEGILPVPLTHLLLNAATGQRSETGAFKPGPPGGGNTAIINVHAMDSKSVGQFFDRNKHVVSRAMAASVRSLRGM